MIQQGRLRLFKMLGIFGCLGFATVLPITVSAQAPPPFDLAHANSYFEEARHVSDKEGGKLWGRRLYGPILFVDQQSRAVIANRQDAQGRLHRHGDVFKGKLTDDVTPSDSPIEWSGTRWTMLLWQFVAEDFSRVTVSAPTKTMGTHLEGHGWTLDLRAEWRAVPSEKSKNFIVRKDQVTSQKQSQQ